MSDLGQAPISNLEGRRVVVTGATGFIGLRLCRLLAAEGAEVFFWSRSSVDLSNAQAVQQGMERDAPDVVFHLASSGVRGAMAHEPSVIGDDLAMMAHLIAYVPSGCHLVVAGSMSEYGSSGRLSESERCMPKTAYGIAKLASTLFALAYGPRRGVRVTVARLFGVYGPGEATERFFPTLLHYLRARKDVALSDGRQRRDFVHVDDACRVMIALALRGGEVKELVNIGTGSAVCIREVAEMVADGIGAPRSLLRFGERSRSPGDADLLVADSKHLLQLIGWVPPDRLTTDQITTLLEGEAILPPFLSG